MKSKIILLYIAMTMSVCATAQSARNPLNRMPAEISVGQGLSSEKLSEIIFYRPDGSPFDKSSFSYNSNGSKKTELIQRWSRSGNQWQNIRKDDYLYSGNAVITETSEWISSKWESRSKTETFYDAAKKKTYSLSYSRNTENDSWNINPSSRSEWKYDENGRVVEYRRQSYNNTTDTWNAPTVCILYTYTDSGELKEELFRAKNPQTGLWDDGGKYTYSINSENRKIAVSSIPVNGAWIADGEIISSTEANGNVVRTDYYGNTAGKSLSAYCLYGYSDKIEERDTADANAVNVYPNPAVNTFEVTVPEILVGKKMNLYDSSGKQVKTAVASHTATRVDVSGLHSGIYFLKIGNISKKIVVR
jgi:hypothetical protein